MRGVAQKRHARCDEAIGQHERQGIGVPSAEELEGYAEVLRRFTPAPSEPGAAAKIDPALREQFPTLVAAIERAAAEG